MATWPTRDRLCSMVQKVPVTTEVSYDRQHMEDVYHRRRSSRRAG